METSITSQPRRRNHTPTRSRLVAWRPPLAGLALGPVLTSALVAVGAVLLAASAASAALVRVSVASDGTEANSFSTASAISADGRHVAFASMASNLVPGDANNASDVFVHDRATGETTRVSAAPGGLDANGASQTPSISADGRLVAFASRARNLGPAKVSSSFDVFVHDRVTGTTVRASSAMDGGDGGGDSFQPWLSADGRYVAFASLAANLVPGDTNATFDVFVHDLATGTTARVSTASDGAQANGLSVSPRTSADGGLVVFHSFASNLVAGDGNGVADVFVHDMATGATVRASLSGGGAQGNQQSTAGSLSADGRFVGFASDASNLVPGDVNGRTDVFVHDLATGATERASVAANGLDGDGQSGFTDPPSLSADGRFVAFTSAASNLVAGDTNVVIDVFVRDRLLGQTRRVSVADDGTQADEPATLWASLTPDGRAVAFASSASTLVPDDANFVQDVFVSAVDCGNGELDAGEECDDGGVAGGDCCAADCTFEAAGGACSDGDLCTQADTCDGAGACVGDDPVVCSGTGDSCRANGACDPTTGTCPTVDAPAGTACSDGDLCTQSDACDGAGTCVGADPVVCTAPEAACQASGACDPATGTCPIIDAPDGTACDDGEACTTGDACRAGTCEPGEIDPAACVDPLRCYRAELGLSDLFRFRTKQVTIADELGTQRYRVHRPTGLCAAAVLGDSSDDPARDLLACHEIEAVWSGWKEPTFARRRVSIENLFGAAKLVVTGPRELCARAKERAGAPSALLDDYACYAVKLPDGHEGWPVKTVKVEDRFGKAAVKVGKPELLCTPASIDGAAIAQPLAHLVCYETRDASSWGGPSLFRPAPLSIEDRFTSGKLFVFFADRLCVPSAVVEVASEARASRHRKRR